MFIIKSAVIFFFILALLVSSTTPTSLSYLKSLISSSFSLAKSPRDLNVNVTNSTSTETNLDEEDLSSYNISNYMVSGRPPPGFVIAPENLNKTDEVFLRNDKTLAHMVYGRNGNELIKCTLYDIENHGLRWEDDARLKKIDKKPIFTDYLTMLDSVRQCTNLARKQVHTLLGNRTLSELEEGNGTDYRGKNWWKLILAGGNVVNGEKLDGTSVFKGIIPGTKWCGIGDIAKDYDDLGPRLDLDICCRAHDHCPIRVKAMSTAYSVSGFSLVTRSHCDCDLDFYRCLQQSKSYPATALGYIYFSLPKKLQCIISEGDKLCDPMPRNSEQNNDCERSNKKTGKLVATHFNYAFPDF